MPGKLTVEDLLAAQEIRDVMAAYFRAVDRMDFEALRSVYHPDAYDNHGVYSGDVGGLIEWLTARHTAIVQSTHTVGNCLVERRGDAADVETYGLLVQHESLGRAAFADGAELFRRTTIGVRYVDRFEKRNDEWRIARHEVVFEWSKEELAPREFDPRMTVALRSPKDAVYRLAGQ
jgi:hypothetical protein